MDAESLRNSGMLSMLTSAEGREKLQSLAAKVGTGAARCGGVTVMFVIDSCSLRNGLAAFLPLRRCLLLRGD
jgi:hypothetical protein